jgi:hypothetical protein
MFRPISICFQLPQIDPSGRVLVSDPPKVEEATASLGQLTVADENKIKREYMVSSILREMGRRGI